MAVWDVVQLGNPLLREKCEAVGDAAAADVAAVVTDLEDTLADCRAKIPYGRGIAAPQIGVLKRIIFLNVDQPWPMVNPSIVERSDETMVVWDACLSYLCVFFQVRRNREIKVRYQDLDGKWHELAAEDDLSQLLQHEIDHLDGILALDRMTDIKTMCTREEYEHRYRDESA